VRGAPFHPDVMSGRKVASVCEFCGRPTLRVWCIGCEVNGPSRVCGSLEAALTAWEDFAAPAYVLGVGMAGEPVCAASRDEFEEAAARMLAGSPTGEVWVAA
jgi:hypothetical protein